MNLSLALYGFETRNFALSRKDGLGLFDNMELRKIFGHERCRSKWKLHKIRNVKHLILIFTFSLLKWYWYEGQDRQCTYEVTLRRVRVTIVAVKKLYVLHILYFYSLSYLAGNAHASYYIVMCVLSASSLVSTLLHKRHDFRRKRITEHNIFFLGFSTTLAWNFFHSKNN